MASSDLIDILRGAYNTAAGPFRNASEYQRNYERLTKSGVKGGNMGLSVGSDADTLAHLLTYGGYDTNPLAQDRYVNLLKQLGYLQQQAR
jgi:hypothetical protein